MLTPLPLLQNVRVASPCNASWEGMEAVDGERVRFCAGCQKKVYNLSAMSQGEAEGLLRKHEGRLCVRYYLRHDGTVLTSDCPLGAYAVRLALTRRSVVAAGLFTLLFGAMAAIDVSQQRQLGAVQRHRSAKHSVVVAPPYEEPAPKPLMGLATTVAIMGKIVRHDVKINNLKLPVRNTTHQKVEPEKP